MLADQERQRLFRIIEDLVMWENTTNETVLQAARNEIWQSWRRACSENADHPRAKELFDRHKLPAFHDPFAGGGALPLRRSDSDWRATRVTEDVDEIAVLVHGTPQILLPSLDLHEHLIQIPGVAHAAPAVPQPPRVVEPERPAPQANRLIGHGDTPFGKEIFDISETQAETVVEPDRVTDDF